MKSEFIPANEYSPEEEETHKEITIPDWEGVMAKLAQPGTTLRVPKNAEFTRKDVVVAFTNAFELIGGTPRLALWAHQNEGDFFKLYSRLLPSQASTALGESNELIIKHVLPKSSLDE